MMPPDTESKTHRYFQEEYFDEAVDYENDTDFMGPNGLPLTILSGEDEDSLAPSPIPERGSADTLTALCSSSDVMSTAAVYINSLDDQQ